MQRGAQPHAAETSLLAAEPVRMHLDYARYAKRLSTVICSSAVTYAEATEKCGLAYAQLLAYMHCPPTCSDHMQVTSWTRFSRHCVHILILIPLPGVPVPAVAAHYH